MYSRHVNPDTGVAVTVMATSQLRRAASIESSDGSDLTLADLRDLVARCADLPAGAVVSARNFDGGTKIDVEHVDYSPADFPDPACPGGDDCVCPDPDEVEQHRRNDLPTF